MLQLSRDVIEHNKKFVRIIMNIKVIHEHRQIGYIRTTALNNQISGVYCAEPMRLLMQSEKLTNSHRV